MEVKINREIRNYTEHLFFGLSIRQFICAICGCLVAVLGSIYRCKHSSDKELKRNIKCVGELTEDKEILRDIRIC